MNYKTYAEAKIANQDCEIFKNGKEFHAVHGLKSSPFGNGWFICNPADYCSTLKEFLDAGFKLVAGDKIITIGGDLWEIKDENTGYNDICKDDHKRYILSSSTLNGGCKIQNTEVNKVNYTIDELLGKYAVYGTDECELFLDALESSGATWPNGKKPREDSVDAECVSLDAVDGNIGNCRKKYYEENGYQLFTSKSNEAESEPWTIYNNTLPLSELSDEQAAMLFNAWRAGGDVEFANTITKDLKSGLTTFKWSIPAILNWGDYQTYRIKQKSERELFIENTTKVMRDAGTKCPDNHEYFGIMFDAGARYTDLTQHFGENI